MQSWNRRTVGKRNFERKGSFSPRGTRGPETRVCSPRTSTRRRSCAWSVRCLSAGIESRNSWMRTCPQTWAYLRALYRLPKVPGLCKPNTPFPDFQNSTDPSPFNDKSKKDKKQYKKKIQWELKTTGTGTSSFSKYRITRGSFLYLIFLLLIWEEFEHEITGHGHTSQKTK